MNIKIYIKSFFFLKKKKFIFSINRIIYIEILITNKIDILIYILRLYFLYITI